jgi:hypothetical protein
MLKGVHLSVRQIVFSLIILIVPAITLAGQQRVVCGEKVQSSNDSITLIPETWTDDVVWTTGDGDNVVWGNGKTDDVVWNDNVVWGNDFFGADNDNVVWGNGVITVKLGSDNVVWGNGVEHSDNVVWGNWVCVGIVTEE